MNSRDFSRYVLAVCAFGTALSACNSDGPQGTPLGSMQQRVAPFDLQKIQPGASVAHGVHRVSPDGIVYTPANVQIENSQYNLDLNNDKTTDFVTSESNGEHRANCGGHYNYSGSLGLTGQGSNGVEVANNYAAQLVSGSPIGPGQSFSLGSWSMEFSLDAWQEGFGCQHLKGNQGNWPPNTSGYLGLAFVIRGETHYGWAALTVRAPRSGWLSATLTGYAYQTRAGKSINAGQM